MYKIKLTIPCQYNNIGYTYAPYEFTYKVIPAFEHNNKLNSLIHDEIKRLSWIKLQEWKKSNPNSTILCIPPYYVENIGQIATDNILQKCKTPDDINKLYELEEKHKIKEMLNHNSHKN